MESLGTRIAVALRREREAAGLSVSELARRAEVSKATISQLEGGAGNPNVETLWAIATALGIPFSVFVDDPAPITRVVRGSEMPAVPSGVAPYAAALLSACPPGARRDLYVIRADPGGTRRSAPHPRGTVEYVVLISGRALVGPESEPVTLEPGDFLTYAGDGPHVFEALEPATSAVLLSEAR
ncbi:XRE family transcriptional regulator [Microbacterium sp. ET2]|uniref:helix-turn-helix domain-containing protein n=1 Tax=Microbacterium albipurpureum TaxID=3050384 RepID=UPI00259CDD76|nr:XRE family transcriptional regulator [Microbacterium sp. ET2 (Ac-2212)]WJL95947.1 XRE family transcriptional regulator [Microbacterium sp. ET2 (Ac-2212)]